MEGRRTSPTSVCLLQYEPKVSVIRFIVCNPKVVYGFLYDVPKSLARKYRELGLKESDATIAAFAECQKVDFFISENRHIYQKLKVEAFFTCNAEEFMNNLNSGKIWQMLH